jgi:FkbH-like protein
MKSLKYSDILKQNIELSQKNLGNVYSIAVLSNITVHPLKEILEYCLRSNGINANINIGDYDNIIQDSHKFNNSNAVLIFWELCNIVDGLQYEIEQNNEAQLNDIFIKIKSEIDYVFSILHKTSLILFNKFSSLPFTHSSVAIKNLEKLEIRLNDYLEKTVPANARAVDIKKVVAGVSVSQSLDFRYFYSSKAPYTVEFFKAYADYIRPYFMSANGKAKKALIFDCDNTLWKGILGEDGFENIEMSKKTKHGGIFLEIQHIAKALNSQGILLGICSKNNFQDVKEVIESHPDMQLRNEHITIIKSNWQDKVTNLQEISNELNIGLDSLVFIDDSSFEVNLIREKLPEVTVIQVPEKLYEYPKVLRDNLNLFYNLSSTDEDRNKTEEYRRQVRRYNEKIKFVDIEDYLISLKLKMTIFQNDESIIPRMSQMSLKTNQFNLTTKRYTERDIKSFIDNQRFEVFAFSTSDRFGDSGITGLCIVEFDDANKKAIIDTFLMSCRIIGRNLEFAFMDHIFKKIIKRDCRIVFSEYIPTRKNAQVSEFFDACSYRLIEIDETRKKYELPVVDYQKKNIKYIEVIDGSE